VTARAVRFAAALALLLAPAIAASAATREDRSGAARTLLFLAEDVPAGLDYDGPSAAIPASQTGIVNLMEPLVYYAPGGVNPEGVAMPDFARLEGRLAESWSFDPGTLTWTFRLRGGVRSCAGNVLTADDVVYTFARAKSISGAAPIGWFLSSAGSIAGFTNAVFADERQRILGDEVRKLDDRTVQIRQDAPNRLLLPVLATFGLLVFDSREARRRATEGDPWSHVYVNNVAAPGFGPYCVERWAKGSTIVLRANPHYYRGRPAIGRVVVKRVPQSANRFMLMRMGEAHLAEKLTPKELRALRERTPVRVAGVTGNESLFLHMNFRTPPFDRPKLRQAIAHAIPYGRIVRDGYFGQASTWSGVVPSSYPGFHAASSPWRFDVQRARRLLAEAGFPQGRGLERFAAAFHLAYVAEKEATLGPIATMIRTALRRVGVPVELDPIPLTQYGDRQLVKKDLPFALNDQEKPVVVDAGYATVLFFVSPDRGGINNMVNHSSPLVDALWAKARVETDPAARDAQLAQAQRLLYDGVAWLPIVEYRTQWAHSAKLAGIAWHPDNAVRFADLRLIE
jgi:peptide/nickel transport system substrate-binding protein